MGMLGSAVKTWHCAAAELLGRLILNPDNEPLFSSIAPQVYFISLVISSLSVACHTIWLVVNRICKGCRFTSD